MKTWEKSELFMLAYSECTSCGGSGVREEIENEPAPCRCALRGAFRACYAHFRACIDEGKVRSHISFERSPRGQSNRGAWGRKQEEYMADFELIARRVLDQRHYKLFRFHFLLGGDWPLYRRRRGGDKGEYFHAIYRIEERVGWALATLEPYCLYPVRDYFGYRLPEGVKACGIVFPPRLPPVAFQAPAVRRLAALRLTA